MSQILTQQLLKSLEQVESEANRKELLGEMFYEQVMHCGVAVKKAKLMKAEYSRAISWLNSEISQTNDASRKESLEGAKANVQKASDEIDHEISALKANLNSLGFSFVYELADVISDL